MKLKVESVLKKWFKPAEAWFLIVLLRQSQESGLDGPNS